MNLKKYFFTFLAFSLLSFYSHLAQGKGIPTGDLLSGLRAGQDGKIDVLTVFLTRTMRCIVMQPCSR